MIVRAHKFIQRTYAEGPGLRACIWFQGCEKRCEGCLSRSTWDKSEGFDIDVFEITKSFSDQEGLTILGGEPFLQPEALKELLYRTKNLGLNTILFTGYTIEEINKNKEYRRVLKYVDLLIDGPYIKSMHDISRPWVGSSNQRFIPLSSIFDDIENILKTNRNKIEMHINPDGSIDVNGMGDFNKFLEEMKNSGYIVENNQGSRSE